jgi:hypothetical protein
MTEQERKGGEGSDSQREEGSERERERKREGGRERERLNLAHFEWSGVHFDCAAHVCVCASARGQRKSGLKKKVLYCVTCLCVCLYTRTHARARACVKGNGWMHGVRKVFAGA